MKDLGNFYTYIPGGSRRQFLDSKPELLLDHVPVICGLVDEYLREHSLGSILPEYLRQYGNMVAHSSEHSENEMLETKSYIDEKLAPLFYFVKNNSHFSDELLRH